MSEPSELLRLLWPWADWSCLLRRLWPWAHWSVPSAPSVALGSLGLKRLHQRSLCRSRRADDKGWYNRGVARWQRQARWVLAVVAIGVMPRRWPTRCARARLAAPAARTEALPPGIAYKTEGGEAIRYKAGDRDITVAFESQTTSTEGETKLHGVQITVDKREGRSFVVTGKEALPRQGQQLVRRARRRQAADQRWPDRHRPAGHLHRSREDRARPRRREVQSRPHERAPVSASPTTSSATPCGFSTRPT